MKEAAQKLGVKLRIWKYGLTWGRDINGRLRVSIIPLDGWIFDQQQITEAFANDPYFRIEYGVSDMELKDE